MCKLLLYHLQWAILSAALIYAQPINAQPSATTTNLTVTSMGSAVSSVTSGTVVTLTGTVQSGNTTVTVGQVAFCEASASSCTATHLIGIVQLTKAGTAVLEFIPGPGSHSYKAVFAGTPNGVTQYAGSTSSTEPLVVTVSYASATTLTSSGNAGSYTLNATVSGMGRPVPTGSVSYLDTSTGNSSLGTAPLVEGTTVLNITNPSNPPAGSTSWSAAVADFNGDGIPDLAVANYGDGTVSIYLGNGDGTFRAAKNSPLSVGQDPLSIVVADFNQDGIPDLAMETGYYSGTVAVLLGNGDGTFVPASNSPITVGGPFNTPGALAVGDFNGDGIPDLVAANDNNVISDPGIMTILLGKGDGTFTATPNSPVTVGSAPLSIAVGDFNGDGNSDLAIVNFAGADVSILLGNGNGTFNAATSSPIAVGSFPWSVATGDFNGDGITDLAVVNSMYTTSQTGTVTILLGNGDGTFKPAANSPVTVGDDPVCVVVGDFNGDGKADLAIANNGADRVSILLGNGDGTFVAAAFSPARTGDFPQSEAVADFNGDGISDLAVANSGNTVNNIFVPQFTQTAIATISDLAVPGTGQHLVKAHFGGDGNYQPSDSATISLTGTGFTVTGNSVSLSPGAMTGNTSTITVTPSGNFTGSVTLTATVTSSPPGAQNLPSFSFAATSPVSLTGANSGTATLTILTTAPASALLVYPLGKNRAFSGDAILDAILFAFFPLRNRLFRRKARLLLIALLFGLGLVACGGGGSTNPGTTPGNYVVTVTGTSGNLTGSSTINLTIE